ncbi:unnamed protein product [Pedinophyceae sp. YPF-701]|nr:unnamed protein product [Pedinophyceae sp. YPF-701]
MNRDISDFMHLSRQQERVRNICILAHVDHGKTTLTDHLVASNGLIHDSMAGQLRYLDSRDDEQARGITMKSSCITLHYRHTARQAPEEAASAQEAAKEYLVNVIDVPGHVDFCSEISTAVRLSDGALIVVDAVEGVCVQTHAVLRQAFEECLQPCLVVNKVDRLALELYLSPEEAYERIRSIIGECNRIHSLLHSETYLQQTDDAAEAAGDDEEYNGEAPQVDDDDVEDVFCPAKGNVVFASAFDGWAFQVEHFVGMWTKKLKCSAADVRSAIWGDWAFQAKTKQFVPFDSDKKTQGGGVTTKLKPVFAQFVLEPLWTVYAACRDSSGDHGPKLAKLSAALGITVAPQALQHPDPRNALRSFLRAWLPLAKAVLSTAVEHVPAPSAAAAHRIPKLVPGVGSGMTASGNTQAAEPTELAPVRQALLTADASEDAPVVAFVAKMIAVPASLLPGGLSTSANQMAFLAFTRIFSGVLRDQSDIFVLSPVHDPAAESSFRCTRATIDGVFIMMGPALERTNCASAGSVVALGGLSLEILKSATIASTPRCWPFRGMSYQTSALVRVAVEPVVPSDMPRLVEGLRLLVRADPFVEVYMMDSGENVVGAAGEVHLQTCMDDLVKRFAGVRVHVSPPLVSFRESLADGADEPAAPADRRTVSMQPSSKRLTVRATVHPLPGCLANALDANSAELQSLSAAALRAGNAALPTQDAPAEPNTNTAPPADLKDSLSAAADSDPDPAARVDADALRGKILAAARQASDSGCAQMLERVFAIGRKNAGACMLLTRPRGKGALPPAAAHSDEAHTTAFQLDNARVSALLGLREGVESGDGDGDGEAAGGDHLRVTVESALVAGFHLASEAGPICDEPMWGVAFEVEVLLHGDLGELQAKAATLSGEIISTVADCCRKAVLEAQPRIAEAMYMCEVTTSAEALSGVYALLGRRRARIIHEEAREGTNLFSLRALLPIDASFGFADEMRRRSSGAAHAQLIFSHWERVRGDPFASLEPVETQEEEEDEAERLTLARDIVNRVRRRKGLPVDDKVVERATKQRTLAKKR